MVLVVMHDLVLGRLEPPETLPCVHSWQDLLLWYCYYYCSIINSGILVFQFVLNITS